MAFSLLIKNARTRFSQGKTLSIGIEGEKIAAVGENLPETGAAQIIDAGGKLVTESFGTAISTCARCTRWRWWGRTRSPPTTEGAWAGP